MNEFLNYSRAGREPKWPLRCRQWLHVRQQSFVEQPVRSPLYITPCRFNWCLLMSKQPMST